MLQKLVVWSTIPNTKQTCSPETNRSKIFVPVDQSQQNYWRQALNIPTAERSIIRLSDLFRHRRIAIVSWGVHDLFFLEVCIWGRVSEVWCCPFFQGGWSSFVCMWVSRLVLQRSPVLMTSIHMVWIIIFYFLASHILVQIACTRFSIFFCW